jgi:hypothetical protein
MTAIISTIRNWIAREVAEGAGSFGGAFEG